MALAEALIAVLSTARLATGTASQEVMRSQLLTGLRVAKLLPGDLVARFPALADLPLV